MSPTKVPLFAGLEDLATHSAGRKPVDLQQVDDLARTNDFPSRPVAAGTLPDTGKPPTDGKLLATGLPIRRRRYVTGRNVQLNIKATADTVRRMGELADRMGVPLGVVLERALASLEASSE